VDLNVFGFSLQLLLLITFLAPGILKWHLDFWKICAPCRSFYRCFVYFVYFLSCRNCPRICRIETIHIY